MCLYISIGSRVLVRALLYLHANTQTYNFGHWHKWAKLPLCSRSCQRLQHLHKHSKSAHAHICAVKSYTEMARLIVTWYSSSIDKFVVIQQQMVMTKLVRSIVANLAKERITAGNACLCSTADKSIFKRQMLHIPTGTTLWQKKERLQVHDNMSRRQVSCSLCIGQISSWRKSKLPWQLSEHRRQTQC